jgi:hypothetical protein
MTVLDAEPPIKISVVLSFNHLDSHDAVDPFRSGKKT